MKSSRQWSGASTSCRLEWRPSRWLVAALVCLSLLAAFSLVNSQLPALSSWPLAALAFGVGLRRALAEWRRPIHRLVLPGDERSARVDDVPVEGLQVEWRGVLAFARWQDRNGNTARLVWWPDTLPADKRRELRLAADAGSAAQRRRSMAP
jgi:toxin CptA